MVLKVNGASQIQYKAIELLLSDENSKWPQKYSNCVKFVAFRHSR